MNHAEDNVIVLDDDFIPFIEDRESKLETVKAYVIMTNRTRMPETKLQPVYEYESLLKKAS